MSCHESWDRWKLCFLSFYCVEPALLLTEEIWTPCVFCYVHVCLCDHCSCFFPYDCCSVWYFVQCENVLRSVFILITAWALCPPWRSLYKVIDAVMSVYQLVTGNKDNKTGPNCKVSSHFCPMSTKPLLPASSYQVLRVNLKYKM